MTQSEQLLVYIAKYVLKNYDLEADGNLEQLLFELRDAEYSESQPSYNDIMQEDGQ